MNQVNNILMSKNGITTTSLSKILILFEEGDRLPTISDFEEVIPVARGTIQNALKVIVSSGALSLEARGAKGTFVVKRNLQMLLHFAGMTSIVGTMPLPYSKRYEGLATGIVVGIEEQHQIPLHLAFMNGAKKRIEMVIKGRYDFTITSKYAAKEAIRNNEAIEIITDFGPKSYLSSHQIVFSKENAKSITSGMRVGIDSQSIDHENLTKLVCKGIDVIYVKLSYHQIIDKLLQKEIDVAVWNEDELRIKAEQLNTIPIDDIDNQEDTSAVIVVSNRRPEMAYLIKKLVNKQYVLQKQEDVLNFKIIPRY